MTREISRCLNYEMWVKRYNENNIRSHHHAKTFHGWQLCNPHPIVCSFQSSPSWAGNPWCYICILIIVKIRTATTHFRCVWCGLMYHSNRWANCGSHIYMFAVRTPTFLRPRDSRGRIGSNSPGTTGIWRVPVAMHRSSCCSAIFAPIPAIYIYIDINDIMYLYIYIYSYLNTICILCN